MINYSIVVAVADNLAIGKDNKMPWHVPGDLKHFKKLTTGNTIIMGRKTFESIGKALPNRKTIVITRTPDDFNRRYKADNLSSAASLDAALINAARSPEKEIFVAGGASIYAQAIEGAQKLYISRVAGEFEGDTFFPEFRNESWKIESSEDFAGFTLEIYLKK